MRPVPLRLVYGGETMTDRIEDRDWYVEHMKRTMDWIGGKLREAEEEAAKDPTVRKRGYDVGIYVEGRWLQQLIAEAVGHYQMIERLQRDLARLSLVDYGDSLLNRAVPQSFVIPTEKK